MTDAGRYRPFQYNHISYLDTLEKEYLLLRDEIPSRRGFYESRIEEIKRERALRQKEAAQ